MLARIFGSRIHTQIHLFCLSVLFFAIPVNKIAMSLSMMVLLLNLILEADFHSYWNKIKSNRLFILISILFFLHVLGLAWSENWVYGFNDVKNKLPLIVIPLILVAKPITQQKHLHILLLSFTFSTLLVSLINYIVYTNNGCEGDFREMSLFGSHIRFSIDVIVAICIALYFVLKVRRFIFPLILIVLWLLYYTYFSQVITGFICLVFALSFLGIHLTYLKNKIFTFITTSVLLGVIIWFVYWLFLPPQINETHYRSMPIKTAKGNPYTYNFKHISPDNGIAYYSFYNKKELKEAWSIRSNSNFDGQDSLGQILQNTLIRYLNELELHKDYDGVMELTDEDIRKIEKGKTSRHQHGMLTRIYSIKHQVQLDRDPNGHSLLERIEFLKVGLSIFKKNFVIGVGTGDVQDAFDSEYILTDSPLNEDKRHRTHNQFLTFGITFGILGIVLFVYLIIQFFKTNSYDGFGFLGTWLILVICASFFLDDTLETQAGVSLFGFILGVFSIKYSFPIKD